jgi:hypothetical protein
MVAKYNSSSHLSHSKLENERGFRAGPTTLAVPLAQRFPPFSSPSLLIFLLSSSMIIGGFIARLLAVIVFITASCFSVFTIVLHRSSAFVLFQLTSRYSIHVYPLYFPQDSRQESLTPCFYATTKIYHTTRPQSDH